MHNLFDTFHNEIICSITDFLPLKDYVNFTSTCKKAREFLSGEDILNRIDFSGILSRFSTREIILKLSLAFPRFIKDIKEIAKVKERNIYRWKTYIVRIKKNNPLEREDIRISQELGVVLSLFIDKMLNRIAKQAFLFLQCSNGSVLNERVIISSIRSILIRDPSLFTIVSTHNRIAMKRYFEALEHKEANEGKRREEKAQLSLPMSKIEKMLVNEVIKIKENQKPDDVFSDYFDSNLMFKEVRKSHTLGVFVVSFIETIIKCLLLLSVDVLEKDRKTLQVRHLKRVLADNSEFRLLFEN